MESEENRQAWEMEHRPKAPFNFVPYLNVKLGDGPAHQLYGDGVIETFVARQLGLMGNNELDAYVCTTVATAAVRLLGPDITEAGLHGRSEEVVAMVHPDTPAVGKVLGNLERYVRKLMESTAGDGEGKYIVASQLTIADLAVFNCLDECLLGPRGHTPLEGVAEVLKENYPTLMRTYAVVEQDLAEYLSKRQAKFHKP